MKKKKPINIAHITLGMDTGGVEVLVLNMVEKLNSAKFRVVIGCLDAGGVLLDMLDARGYEVFVTGRRPGLDWKLIIKLTKIFKGKKIQIVHTHNQAAHFYGGIAAKLAGVPVLVTTEHSRHNIAAYLRRRMEKRFLCAITDKWVVVSKALKKLSTEVDRVPENRIQVIDNGIDFERFCSSKITGQTQKERFKTELGLPACCKVVIMVARLDPIKQHCLVIDALSGMKTKLQDVHLLLVGDGESGEELMRQCRKRKMAKQVHFLGVRADVPELLAVSDVFVLCSKSEGLPVSLLEACAAGVPVLITESANAAGIINHCENGTVVEGNAGALARGLVSIFSDLPKYRKMALKSSRLIKNRFSLAAMVSVYEDLYHKLLTRKK